MRLPSPFQLIRGPLLAALLLGPACLPPALAASASTAASAQSIMDAMAKANAAVVGVKVTAVKEARSARTLGLNRSGSGVVIGSDGLILTIGYLMLEAEQIEIITQEGKTLPAVAVAYDLATGFGLIKPLLPLRGVAPVALGSQQDLKPGEPLMAATGASDSDEGGVSMTQLVSQRAFSGTWEYHLDSALFTSPPVSSGRGNHSGAPLFNHKGELMGIGSLLVMDALGENKRMPGNMFVPIDLLKPILSELRQSGSSMQSNRPWLGLTSTDQGGSVRVMRVAEGSPADDAGLRPGAVVQAVDGAPVATLEAFYKKVWAHESPDQPVKLTVRDGDDIKTINIKPQNRMLSLKKPAGI
ncbi:MAG: S1C family serine protease [Polaromonas sp.]|jgi:serine protease Do